MGWFGYNIYGGDGTQTSHLIFCQWAKLYKNDNDGEWQDSHLTNRGTKLNEQEQITFLKNLELVLKKMPKRKFFDDGSAIDWQMLLALFVDNSMACPKIIFDKGIEATEFLMGEHAAAFDKPCIRRQYLRKFIKKSKKSFDKSLKSV